MTNFILIVITGIACVLAIAFFLENMHESRRRKRHQKQPRIFEIYEDYIGAFSKEEAFEWYKQNALPDEEFTIDDISDWTDSLIDKPVRDEISETTITFRQLLEDFRDQLPCLIATDNL